MSPLLEPPAACPHATDPAPCLNRCSINNACSSATLLPGGQMRRGAEWMRERERLNESVFLEGGQEGRRMGKSPEARLITGRWIHHARRSQTTSEPTDGVFDFAHLLHRRTRDRDFFQFAGAYWSYLIPWRAIFEQACFPLSNKYYLYNLLL